MIICLNRWPADELIVKYLDARWPPLAVEDVTEVLFVESAVLQLSSDPLTLGFEVELLVVVDLNGILIDSFGNEIGSNIKTGLLFDDESSSFFFSLNVDPALS